MATDEPAPVSTSRYGPGEVAAIATWSHRPRRLLDCMQTVANPPRPLEVPAGEPDHSSLGSLDAFPGEVLSLVLELLDLQSLARLSRVSQEGRAVVALLPAYRELMHHAPDAAARLAQTKLISLHPVAALRAALRSARCCSCSQYGTYLFLPTCERCCWECLRCNPSMLMITEQQAVLYFHVPLARVRELPALVKTTKQFSFLSNTVARSVERLQTVKVIRDLAIEKFGSAENLPTLDNEPASHAAMRNFVHGSYGIERDQDPLSAQNADPDRDIPKDRRFGYSAINFPSIGADGEVDRGLWCRGCENTYLIHHNNEEAITTMVPQGWEPAKVLQGLGRRAWTTRGFLAHCQDCFFIQQTAREQDSPKAAASRESSGEELD